MTSNQISTSIMCKYTPEGCNSHVPDATKNNNIFSVGGELVMLGKSIFILAEAIEWNYSPSTNSTGVSNKTQRSKRARVEELEKIAENFDQRSTTSPSYKKQNRKDGEKKKKGANSQAQNDDTNPSATKATKLKILVKNVAGKNKI